MRLSLSVDRFEGPGKSVAVLLTDDGQALQMPRALLPPGSGPGDMLRLTIEKDAPATRKLAEETREVQRRLAEDDPGGDIRL